MRDTLDALALRHGTDKASNSHNYTALYARLFEPLRELPITLLELGWGGDADPHAGGASARMWRDYFPAATVVVIDHKPKLDIPDGVNFRHGSQADEAFIAALQGEFGWFDIVVDDASHRSSATIRSWQLLYPHLSPQGWYIVEDTHGSYHAHFYGSAEANPDPRGATSSGQPTAMQYFERLADCVNYRTDGVLYPARFWQGYRIESIAFYFNVLAIRKAAA